MARSTPNQLSLADYAVRKEARLILASCLAIEAAQIEESLALLAGPHPDKEAYIHFTIPKSSGGKRDIRAPREPLKTLLRRVNTELLARHPLNPHIHGFRTRRSIVTNAGAHLANGANHLVNFDIRDCFPSTPVKLIRKAYEWTVGKWLKAEGVEGPVVDAIIDILAQLSALRYGRAETKVLPMGSPTSPALLNLVLQPFDLRLAKHLREIGQRHRLSLTYTRYGDDLSISCPEPLPNAVFGLVPSLLSGYGYRLSTKKTRVMHRGGSGGPLEVTGLVIGEGRLLLSDQWLKKAEALLNRIRHGQDLDGKAKSTLRGIFGLAKMVYGGELPPRLAKFAQLAQELEHSQGAESTPEEDTSPYAKVQDLQDSVLTFDGPPDPTGITDPFDFEAAHPPQSV